MLVPEGCARWLLHKRSYLPDSEHIRGLVPYLLQGIGLAQRQSEAAVTIRHDGVVELRREGRVVGSWLPGSGEGTHHWSAIEPRVNAVLKKMAAHETPSTILTAGLQGSSPREAAPPQDIRYQVVDGDVADGDLSPLRVTVDEIRADPTLAARTVAKWQYQVFSSSLGSPKYLNRTAIAKCQYPTTGRRHSGCSCTAFLCHPQLCKQDHNVLDGLRQLFEGQAWLSARS